MAIKMEELEDDDLFDTGRKSGSSKSQMVEEEDIPHGEVDFLHDVPMHMKAQIGSTHKTMKEVLALKSGSIVEFNRVVGESLDVIIGGRIMCRGEIVVVNERYGIRISEVLRIQDKTEDLNAPFK